HAYLTHRTTRPSSATGAEAPDLPIAVQRHGDRYRRGWITVTLPGSEPQELVGLDRLECTDGTLFLDVQDGAELV
ncbi:hypothetical protein, partial [Sulfitobacter sp. 1A15258]|uniref:hypothetical protein n=1 Tax=Sulfitobacter sp. 1A15258 TaxID=3368588 RepID=UPI003745A1F1